MTRTSRATTAGDLKVWSLDQLTKSEFFHQKLHEWGLLVVASAIERTKGELLRWNVAALRISTAAWEKVIHRGIKPVTVFAHPAILEGTSGAVGYYRMLSMVSQKSMHHVGLPVTRYEEGSVAPTHGTALAIAQHFNRILSRLIELDGQIDAREFELWRGMAAGSQAQGSWQNAKGNVVDALIRGIIQRRVQEKRLISVRGRDIRRAQLKDGRLIVFADEPDVAVYQDREIQVAVEIKGGIDRAGALERLGAALKSLQRVREQNPRSTTVLILQGVSLTPTTTHEITRHRQTITDWLTIEDVLEREMKREQLFRLLRI